tara:strand:- start:440 stop:844 length:405 start_codon:yes stop_codon:yes gene_type:complete
LTSDTLSHQSQGDLSLIRIARPLLPFSRNRPDILTHQQLRAIRQLVAFCSTAFSLLFGFLWFAELGRTAELTARIVMLFIAVIPGLVLEHILDRNSKQQRHSEELETVPLFGVEAMQLAFVLSLGWFLWQDSVG